MQSESNKVMLCYVMLCYVMLCYVMLCYVMLCYVMLLRELINLQTLRDQMRWLIMDNYNNYFLPSSGKSWEPTGQMLCIVDTSLSVLMP